MRSQGCHQSLARNGTAIDALTLPMSLEEKTERCHETALYLYVVRWYCH